VVEGWDVVHDVEIVLVELGQVGTGIRTGLAPGGDNVETENQDQDRFHQCGSVKGVRPQGLKPTSFLV
jgi:hypothetical protein